MHKHEIHEIIRIGSSLEHAGLLPILWNALAADVIVTGIASHPAVVFIFIAFANITFPFAFGSANASRMVGY